MPRLRPAEQALRLLADTSRQQFVCRTCRAQAVRQLHSSLPSTAERPFHQRMRETLFGDNSGDINKSEQAKQDEEEQARQKRVELARQDEAADSRKRRIISKSGREYQVARHADATVTTDYAVATESKELERVGGPRWVRAQRDQGEQYHGFGTRTRLEWGDSRWIQLLHHVVVEVLALQNAGRNVSEVFHPRTPGVDTREQTQLFEIGIENGAPSLKPVDGNADLKSITQAIDQFPDHLEERSIEKELNGVFTKNLLGPEELPSWKHMSLSDPTIKLAITKRITQLTGKRITDPTISSIQTLGDLFGAVKTIPKPTKLAHTAEFSRAASIPNVRAHGSKRTMMHNEKRIGRWKLIEEELYARDMRVPGSRGKKDKVKVKADN